MAVRAVNNSMDFTSLKETLEVADGNLASHLRTLEEGGYINMEKSVINRKPNTNYTITEKGLESFKSHLQALEDLINKR
ncbi:transcriptional regulator [bacterium]|nr:transcriptional regulator [bacterium]